MTVLNGLKRRLLSTGSDSFVLLLAFRMQAAAHGVLMQLSGDTISLLRGRRKMILGMRDAISVPFAVHEWDQFFETLEGEQRGGRVVLDFSGPGLHRYRRHKLSFYAPSLAEDDSMEAYTASYRPRAGDVVWDAGAHAGMTAYFLAQMVGPTGKVYAFEPDETNYGFLLRNIEMHALANVTPVKAALSGKTGRASFCMDGTMSAGLSDSLCYSAGGHGREVETICPQDACERFGSVPDFIKMDIEGAELSVVASAVGLLKQHPIHLSIESNHMVGGRFTSGSLEELLGGAGYRAWSSDRYGQLFTWAAPAGARADS